MGANDREWPSGHFPADDRPAEGKREQNSGPDRQRIEHPHQSRRVRTTVDGLHARDGRTPYEIRRVHERGHRGHERCAFDEVRASFKPAVRRRVGSSLRIASARPRRASRRHDHLGRVHRSDGRPRSNGRHARVHSSDSGAHGRRRSRFDRHDRRRDDRFWLDGRRRRCLLRRGSRRGSDGRGSGRTRSRRLLGSRWRRWWRGRRRSRGGRRRGCRRRVGGTPRREQAEWVDVSVLADPNAEMDVRNRMLCIARRPRVSDRVSLGDERALPDAEGPEMRERRLVSVASEDRDRETVRRDLSGERHLARRGGADGGAVVYCDVDAAMLARGVLVSGHCVAAEHVAVGWPDPRPSRCAGDERPDQSDDRADDPSRCPVREHGATVASALRDGNAIDRLVTECRDRGNFGTRRSGAPPPQPQTVVTLRRRRDPQPQHARPRCRPLTARPRPAPQRA